MPPRSPTDRGKSAPAGQSPADRADSPYMTFAGFQDAPPPSPEQVRDLLLRMLREMQPEFVEHIPVLAAHARATAMQLGLAAGTVEEITYHAELHDIGKLA